jgi:hypothetical protein
MTEDVQMTPEQVEIKEVDFPNDGEENISEAESKTSEEDVQETNEPLTYEVTLQNDEPTIVSFYEMEKYYRRKAVPEDGIVKVDLSAIKIEPTRVLESVTTFRKPKGVVADDYDVKDPFIDDDDAIFDDFTETQIIQSKEPGFFICRGDVETISVTRRFDEFLMMDDLVDDRFKKADRKKKNSSKKAVKKVKESVKKEGGTETKEIKEVKELKDSKEVDEVKDNKDNQVKDNKDNQVKDNKDNQVKDKDIKEQNGSKQGSPLKLPQDQSDKKRKKKDEIDDEEPELKKEKSSEDMKEKENTPEKPNAPEKKPKSVKVNETIKR